MSPSLSNLLYGPRDPQDLEHKAPPVRRRSYSGSFSNFSEDDIQSEGASHLLNSDGMRPVLDSSTEGGKNFRSAVSRQSVLIISLCTNLCIAALLIRAALWPVVTFPTTDLRDQVLTPDGKSFSSGLLSWSQVLAPLPCGTSPAVAKSRGCHFDIISTSWLPSECIDYELASEFESFFAWNYYVTPSRNGTYSSEADTLGAVPNTIWTTKRWHTAHCLFMWKKLNRAILNGKKTDAGSFAQMHVDHCAEMISKESDDWDKVSGYIEINYPPC